MRAKGRLASILLGPNRDFLHCSASWSRGRRFEGPCGCLRGGFVRSAESGGAISCLIYNRLLRRAKPLRRFVLDSLTTHRAPKKPRDSARESIRYARRQLCVRILISSSVEWGGVGAVDGLGVDALQNCHRLGSYETHRANFIQERFSGSLRGRLPGILVGRAAAHLEVKKDCARRKSHHRP
jgi:hypothetical protein